MADPSIDYRGIYFVHKTLSPIRDEPTYDSLQFMWKEHKVNAASVHSTLGGTDSYLFLIISPARYNRVSATPFVCPIHPGPLVIPPCTPAHQIEVIKAQHKEELRIYREVNGVEKAMLQMTMEAIPKMYLQPILNIGTNTFDRTMRGVMQWLLDTYGKVTILKLSKKEDMLKSMSWEAQKPVDIIFTAIEEYQDMADTATQPITNAQMVKYAYVVLHKFPPYRDGIKEWNRRPAIQHTWMNMKLHFRRIQAELRETGDLTLNNLHSANIVQQIIDGVNRGLQIAPPFPDSSTEPSTISDNQLEHFVQSTNAINAHSDLQRLQEQISTLTQQVTNI